jgi:hypothetical protein
VEVAVEAVDDEAAQRAVLMIGEHPSIGTGAGIPAVQFDERLSVEQPAGAVEKQPGVAAEMDTRNHEPDEIGSRENRQRWQKLHQKL